MNLAIGQNISYPCKKGYSTNLEKNWQQICELSQEVAELWVFQITFTYHSPTNYLDKDHILWINKTAIVIEINPLQKQFPYLAIYFHDNKFWLIGRTTPEITERN